MMKRFALMLALLLTLAGCGGGGGGGAKESVLAVADVESGMRAYDAIGQSTYLPALFFSIYSQYGTTNVAQQLNCNSGGTIDISYKNYGFVELVGKYLFDRCTLDLGGSIVYLDGVVYEAESPAEFHYNDFPNIVGTYMLIEKGFIFRLSENGSELTLTYQQERYDNRVNFINKKSYSWAIVSEDSQTGTITKQIDFTGTFVSSTLGTVSTSGWLSKEGNTLYYLAGTGGEKLFYVDFDDNTYLDSAQYATDDKLVLVGSNGSNVTLWQDSTDAVHALDTGGEAISFTSYTPEFW